MNNYPKRKYDIFTPQQIEEIINNSKTKKEVLIKLGYTGNSTSNHLITEISERYNISIEHLEKCKDLTGQTFGRWTIIKKSEDTDAHGQTKWVCQCSCKNKTIRAVRNTDLTLGKSKSCGCIGNEKYKEYWKSRGVDLAGQRFGKLTVLEKDNTPHKNGYLYWICQCDCGNTVIVNGSSLRKENGTRSCGCLNSEGEMIISQILTNKKVNFKRQFSFKDLIGDSGLLKFDFAVLDSKENILYLIEYQGEQHYFPIEHFGGQEAYEKQVKFDNLKREYCLKNNIPLLEISYKDKNKIEQILKGWSGLKYD